jgi:hypothetical protein
MDYDVIDLGFGTGRPETLYVWGNSAPKRRFKGVLAILARSMAGDGMSTV